MKHSTRKRRRVRSRISRRTLSLRRRSTVRRRRILRGGMGAAPSPVISDAAARRMRLHRSTVGEIPVEDARMDAPVNSAKVTFLPLTNKKKKKKNARSKNARSKNARSKKKRRKSRKRTNKIIKMKGGMEAGAGETSVSSEDNERIEKIIPIILDRVGSHNVEKVEILRKGLEYTVKRKDKPLFYTASRFYFSIIHHLKNKDINNLTLNELSDDSQLKVGMEGFRQSVISSSLSLCNTDLNESATFLLFNPQNIIPGELHDMVIKGYVKGMIDHKYHGFIDEMDLEILKERVLIVLSQEETVSRSDNVKLTGSFAGKDYGVPSKEAIITKNQGLDEISEWRGDGETANQVRLLYKHSDFRTETFLTGAQNKILAQLNEI